MANYSGKGAPSNGSVYVCNLPQGTDEDMLAEYFGTIGLLKVRSSRGICQILYLFIFYCKFLSVTEKSHQFLTVFSFFFILAFHHLERQANRSTKNLVIQRQSDR